jgi:hypothetical protein
VIATRGQLAIAFAVLMAFGWWVTGQDPFSTSGTIGILASGVAVIVLARLWRKQVPAREDTHGRERVWIWIVVLALLVAWEVTSYFGSPRDAHPTISSITDPLQAQHVARWLLFGGWLALGWSLAE